MILDNFDRGLRNPHNNKTNRALWMFYEGDFTEKGDKGSVGLSNAARRFHGRGLRATVRAGNCYLYFNTTNDHTGVTDRMAQHVYDPKAWQGDTIERLSFWVRTPPGIPTRTDGGFNVHVANFVRTQDEEREQESNPNGKQGHWYYYLNIPDIPTWHKVEVDLCHPHHLRAAETQEWGLIRSPFDENGRNMADCMTKFYIDFKGDGPNGTTIPIQQYPAVFDFDCFGLSAIPSVENVWQVYNLTASYERASNRLAVHWSRKRTEENLLHEVRWSYANIREIGWASAKPAPNGSVKGLGGGGYNAMRYLSDEIPLKQAKRVYLAIKPQNTREFRQVYLPLV